MQTFGLNYEIKPDQVDGFVEKLMVLIGQMEETSGHIETRLFVDVAQPNMMMIYSNWKSKAEFSGFVRSRAFREALDDAAKLLIRKPEHFFGENVRLIKQAG